MSADNAWMPLYVGDYLADTMHLSGAEHGAYLLLLMHAWRTGPLPDDNTRLAAIARTEPSSWRRMASSIRAFFDTTEDGLVQRRLERVRAEQGGKIEQRRAAGRASAEARKRQRKPNERSTTVATPLAVSLQQTGRELELEPDKSSETTSPPAEAPPSPAVTPPPDARSALWSEGLARLRRLTGKGDGQARGLMGQLCRLAADDCALVGSLLHEAEVNRVGDPIPWLQAAIRTRTGARITSKPSSALGQWADLLNAPPPTADFDGQAEEVFQ